MQYPHMKKYGHFRRHGGIVFGHMGLAKWTKNNDAIEHWFMFLFHWNIFLEKYLFVSIGH